MKGATLRVARACRDLPALGRQYAEGLGFEVLSQWRDHEGFDGMVLGHPQAPYHLEFIHAHDEPMPPAPHPEQLLVFYLDPHADWQRACARMQAAGFRRATNANPYWERNGATWVDLEGGRVVLNDGAWPR